MSARRRPGLSDAALLAELGVRLEPGRRWSGEIVDGDIVAEVTVTVRRRVNLADRDVYAAAALRVLELHPSRREHCECTTTKKHSFSRTYASCSKPIVAAVVGVGGIESDFYGSPYRFRFVCAAHRDHHPTATASYGASTLGVVNLSPTRLAELRRRADADYQRMRCVREGMESFGSIFRVWDRWLSVPTPGCAGGVR